MSGWVRILLVSAVLAACSTAAPVVDDALDSEGVEVAGDVATAEPDPEPFIAREPALPARNSSEATASDGTDGDGTAASTPSGAVAGEGEADSSDPVEDTSMSTPVPPDLIEAMKADLASRLGIDPSAVTLVSGRAVTWSDSSLGCPEPGEMYLQVLTDGYQVVLSAGGAQYDYRADTRGTFKLCENSGGGGEVGQDG